jgi:hypothetical protein
VRNRDMSGAVFVVAVLLGLFGIGAAQGSIEYDQHYFSAGAYGTHLTTPGGLLLAPSNDLVYAPYVMPKISDTYALGLTNLLWQHIYASRSLQGSKTKTLTESAATSLVKIAVPQTAGSNFADARIEWVVYAADATDTQTLKGADYVSAVNKAGVETCTRGAVGTAINAVSAGTLTCTPTCVVGLTDEVEFALNCTSSLTQTTLKAQFRADMMQINTYTPQ